MAKIKGVCKNYDECDLAAGKEVQEAEKTAFVCTECGKPLYPVKESPGPDGPGWKKRAIVAAVTIMASGGVYFGLFHEKEHKSTDGNGGDTTAIDSAAIIKNKEVSDTAEVKVDSLETKTAGLKESVNKEESVMKEKKNDDPQSKGMLDLGYAVYEGDKSAGKPHGNGSMEFKSRHLIPGAKADCVASPGEKVIGAFRNGEVNFATWYRNDGNQVVVKHK
ncbi:MAG: hypothetical protein LBR26_13860 [Prevotella sp.]|jgi:hypothetical protein|nr:hypothetical protein [Prevotella sp.]